MQNRWISLLELFGKLLKCKTLVDALREKCSLAVPSAQHHGHITYKASLHKEFRNIDASLICNGEFYSTVFKDI